MDNRELDLYFEYFNRLNRELLRPDLIIILQVDNIETLLKRIRTRGREEESNIDESFLAGLNAYYSTFAQVCEKKYSIPVHKVNVEKLDIRSAAGKQTYLAEVERKLGEIL
jgi:deoxyadenosine/deoxycytidine kinase